MVVDSHNKKKIAGSNDTRVSEDVSEDVQRISRGCPAGIQRIVWGCIIMHTSA